MDEPAADVAVDALGPAPVLSAILPCWNSAASIQRAIESVLAERDIALECIVVDDGSTDSTVEIERSIADRDPRLVLVSSPANEGVSAARNRALRVARGTWLTFVDADDCFLAGGVAALMRAARETDALVVVGQRILSDGERQWITRGYDQPDIREPGRKSLVRNPGLMFSAAVTGKLFHRSCTDDLWFEGRVLGDQPWTIRALLRAGDRIQVIEDTVYEWTRPGPSHQFASITAAKQDSAYRAAEAVVVARGALRQVSGEADRLLKDESSRRVIVGGYVERLVKADLAGPVSRALQRADPGTPQLLDSIGELIAAIPPDVVASSRPMVDRVLRPPLTYWRHMRPEARTAYWALLRRYRTTAALATTRSRRPVSILPWLVGAWDHAWTRGVAGILLWVASAIADLLRAGRARLAGAQGKPGGLRTGP